MSQAEGPDDVRWRVVSGLETTYLYTQKLVSNTAYMDLLHTSLVSLSL